MQGETWRHLMLGEVGGRQHTGQGMTNQQAVSSGELGGQDSCWFRAARSSLATLPQCSTNLLSVLMGARAWSDWQI